MSNDVRFRALVEHASDILGLIAADGRILYSSPSAERLLGAPDLADSDLLERVHPDDTEEVRRSLSPDAGPADGACRARLRGAGDTWILFDLRTSPAPEGEDGVLLCARPVTDSASARDLRAAQEYRRFFEESRDAIVLGTLDGHILDINPAGLRLFGYESKTEMQALDIARDLYWNPEDRQRAMDDFREKGYSDDSELELKSRNGQRLRVKESASAIRDEDGDIIGIRAVLRDITEQRRIEEHLRQSQKMEAVGRLAGGVAHDFNNLLTAINGYSELAIGRLVEDDPLRSTLEEIRKAGKRATDLTRRLLTLSRHQVVSPRRISLNRCVIDMEKLLQRVLGEDMQLRTRLDQDLPPI
ncbi:MAG: PAS domain S-box protein, partial [Holophagales bacterium]|nr:PAS domain S-box protein [Holophagales bacterium]